MRLKYKVNLPKVDSEVCRYISKLIKPFTNSDPRNKYIKNNIKNELKTPLWEQFKTYDDMKVHEKHQA